VKGTLHWVCADHALDAEVRLYDHLFTEPDLGSLPEGKTNLDVLNPDSLKIITAKVEPGLASAQPGTHFQFLRKGYFCVDPDSTKDKLVFNRTVQLRSSWKPVGK